MPCALATLQDGAMHLGLAVIMNMRLDYHDTMNQLMLADQAYKGKQES